ncbi:serine/threonine-protein kinase [Hyalangium minutum]|uniref:non-specific serine/threonine protein kinase n=1 Tax=Hyalangium minutum TaxID=394096 RepID=A0A085WGA3_9BACT|nr:serine/threonine-protein kinase [Hyalangium minutum]KFE66716.1 Serine/threonine protein kinase PrkC, regulator of stationary phase [Hyalangium minutum]
MRTSAEGDEYIGKTLAKKYRVEALIGEGGMGKVYRARQLALDKPVVLKVLRQSLLSDERTVARFQREAKAASRLNHPNSISILDFGQAEDGALFIAMEFVPGQDLHQVLSREWPLPESRVVRIVSQVLSALSDAHGAGVIHRDLKPENIMLEQRRNDPDFVKVLDFGIAKITDTNGDEGPALTRAGFVCGTPEYMSPEQARGAQLDHRSDLYAVGVILYQLTTGLLPFESDSAVGFATKHLTEEPPPPTKRRPEARISPGMERLILRVLSKDPNDRPANAEAFKAELLAVDRDRRRLEATARRAPVAQPPAAPMAAPVLAPLPRRATGGSHIDTQPGTDPGWGTNEPTVEATVRAVPELMQTVQNPMPITSDKTEAIVATIPEEETGGFGFFKALTITLVIAALAIGGYYYYINYGGGQAPEEPYALPDNVPLPGQNSATGPDLTKPLYEQEIPVQNRNAQKAREAEIEGDRQFERGYFGMAATEYKKAFGFDPRPDLSLKLVEVYLQNGKIEEARNWWTRHRKDAPDTKAADHIEQALKSATAIPPQQQ